MSDLDDIKKVLRTVLDESRHCYDYTAKYHYLATTREEWKKLLEFVGLEAQAAKFQPTKSRKS